jgi:hypothetical protein
MGTGAGGRCVGGVHVAYDTYQAGTYDVLLRHLAADGTPGR